MTQGHIVTDDIGGRMRRAREARGLSLGDAARRTKLSISVLQAIERNDFASLPGGMFRKAYLRTLATEVGLNPNEVAAHYCAQFEPPVEPLPVIKRRAAVEDKWVEQLTPSPRRSIGTLAILAASAVAWFMLQPEPAGSTMPVDDADGPHHAGTPRLITVENPAARLWITIQATGWCWVAAETDGERAMYRLVEPGERVRLEAQRLISLRLGDAGSVTLSINDSASRSVGRHGEVVEFELTPESVEGLRDGAVEAASDGLLIPNALAQQWSWR